MCSTYLASTHNALQEATRMGKSLTRSIQHSISPSDFQLTQQQGEAEMDGLPLYRPSTPSRKSHHHSSLAPLSGLCSPIPNSGSQPVPAVQMRLHDSQGLSNSTKHATKLLGVHGIPRHDLRDLHSFDMSVTASKEYLQAFGASRVLPRTPIGHYT